MGGSPEDFSDGFHPQSARMLYLLPEEYADLDHQQVHKAFSKEDPKIRELADWAAMRLQKVYTPSEVSWPK
ncbi:hypothetical protein HDU85_000540 [Gaertneriomyces sp. JEL0708]|nr:hypothetical protein HDU85_000540 [Gaertneriomyces sp. JEL0708]